MASIFSNVGDASRDEGPAPRPLAARPLILRAAAVPRENFPVYRPVRAGCWFTNSSSHHSESVTCLRSTKWKLHCCPNSSKSYGRIENESDSSIIAGGPIGCCSLQQGQR